MEKNIRLKNYLKTGVSIIEMLVVISIFAVLGVVVTQSLALSLRGTNKSGNVSEVRQNVEYVTSIIERRIRNADDIDIDSCSGSGLDLVVGEETHTISCIETSGVGTIYINENQGGGNVAISSPQVDFDCSPDSFPVFACSPSGVNPPYVDISLIASSLSASEVEGSTITVHTRVSLRNYR